MHPKKYFTLNFFINEIFSVEKIPKLWYLESILQKSSTNILKNNFTFKNSTMTFLYYIYIITNIIMFILDSILVS